MHIGKVTLSVAVLAALTACTEPSSVNEPNSSASTAIVEANKVPEYTDKSVVEQIQDIDIEGYSGSTEIINSASVSGYELEFNLELPQEKRLLTADEITAFLTDQGGLQGVWADTEEDGSAEEIIYLYNSGLFAYEEGADWLYDALNDTFIDPEYSQTVITREVISLPLLDTQALILQDELDGNLTTTVMFVYDGYGYGYVDVIYDGSNATLDNFLLSLDTLEPAV